jgi:septal ring factor EnvC (AmiA/AmiB activator)
MSNNLANLMVGFGLDLSALQKDAPEAFRILNSQTLGMSAEMKRASREGAESFRLIDEALGIHVSRPLTRILTQEFPGLATALQSVLGAGIVGALGKIAFETFEKVSKGIENAQKSLEEYSKAIQHTQDVIGDMGATHVRAMKEIGLELEALSGESGAKLKLTEFKVDTSAMQEAKKNIEAITKALDEQAKAAEKAHGFWSQLVNTLVTVPTDFWAKLFGGGEESVNKIKEVDALLSRAMREHTGDPLKGLKESLKEVEEEAKKTQSELYTLQLANVAQANKIESGLGAQGDVPAAMEHSRLASSQEKANALAGTVIGLNAQIKALKNAIEEAMGRDKIDAVTAAIEAQKKAASDLSSLYKEMSTSLAKLQPETDPIKKLSEEIEAFKDKAEDAYEKVRQSSASAFATNAAVEALDSYERKLDQIKIKLSADILSKQALDLLNKPLPSGPFTAATAPASSGFQLPAAPTPVMPTLGAGGTAAAQFDVFSKDTATQLKAAAAAYADLETPQQKYQLAQQELNLLLEKGYIDWSAYTAALQKASDEMVQGENHFHKMQEELQKLLERSTEASAGIQAFFKQLQIDAAENGKATFSILNEGLKGFEDETTKAIFTGKTNWEDMFRSMAESAFKFMEQKEIAGLFQMISGTGSGKSLGAIFGIGQGQQGPAPALPPTAPGSLTGLGALVGGGATGTGPQLAAAATTLQTGSTTLITAATALQAAALSLETSSATSGAGGGSGIIGDLTDSGALGLPGFASGTDDAPGGLAWVGEQGPELLNLPGGSSVRPAGSLRSSGGDSHYYDMRGAVVTEELMRKADFARAMQAARPQMIGEVMANVSELQKRTLQSR